MSATFSYRQGETFSYAIEAEDGVTAYLVVKSDVDDAVPIMIFEAAITDGVGNFYDQVTAPPGTYLAQITIIYEDGSTEKFGSGDCGGDECEFYEFVVCEALDPGVS